MTTQPEGRLFRLSPDESPLAADTNPAPAPAAAGEAGGKAPGKWRARKREQAEALAAGAGGEAAGAGPADNVAEAKVDADSPAGTPEAGASKTAAEATTGEAPVAEAPKPEAIVEAKAAAAATPAEPGQPQDGARLGNRVRIEVRRRDEAASPEPGPRTASGAPMPAGIAAADHANLLAPDEDDDGFAGMSFPGGRAQPAPGPAPQATPPQDDAATLAAEVEAVRAERLTPRQLRVANRLAVAQGITAASDEEAVALLRRRGIDPLHRSALTRIVAEEGKRATATPSPQAPSLIERTAEETPPRRVTPLPAPAAPERPVPNLPSREAMTEERRAAEIFRIQRDIARRRRRRMFMLFARLAAFVALPTILAGWYYFTQATPLYATESAFQIQKAENLSGGSIGSIFAGTQLATNPDSVAVQSYLGSRDAMLRLDRDIGFKRVFQDPSIDPLLRLPPDATDEEAYSLYQNSVKISYDPSEGVLGMEVIAPDPNLSQQYSLALIRYAEGQVDQMTARLREDQMTGAMASYREAEAKVEEAQRRIQGLQQKLGVLDPVAEGTAAMTQISTLETELTQKQLELGQLLANERPNQSRVRGVEGDIARLEQMIAERRAALTEDSAARNSLAAVTGELRIAEADLLTRQQLLAAAAGQLEAARIEANKQVRYLSLAVAPVPPDTPTYPKAGQNTIVAFLIFAGIYLMLSLTASILREQVST